MKKQLIAFYFIAMLIGVLASCGAPNESEVLEPEHAADLHSKIDTLEVKYMNWACACANWLPTTYLEDSNYNASENTSDCIYIEASEDKMKLPEDLKAGNITLQVIGSFYKEKGVSKDYIQPTSEKPEEARVFRYTDVGIVKY